MICCGQDRRGLRYRPSFSESLNRPGQEAAVALALRVAEPLVHDKAREARQLHPEPFTMSQPVEVESPTCPRAPEYRNFAAYARSVRRPRG